MHITPNHVKIVIYISGSHVNFMKKCMYYLCVSFSTGVRKERATTRRQPHDDKDKGNKGGERRRGKNK